MPKPSPRLVGLLALLVAAAAAIQSAALSREALGRPLQTVTGGSCYDGNAPITVGSTSIVAARDGTTTPRGTPGPVTSNGTRIVD